MVVCSQQLPEYPSESMSVRNPQVALSNTTLAKTMSVRYGNTLILLLNKGLIIKSAINIKIII